MAWLYLALAIGFEVAASSALKAAEGFTRLLPSVVVVIGYVSAFYCLSLTLRSIPLGIAYAVWSGAGTALISLIGWLVYRQTLDLSAWIGIVLIISGVVVLNISSSNTAH